VLMTAFLAGSQAIVLDDSINVKQVLLSSKEFNQELFSKLLTRSDIPHIFLSDVTRLINGIKKDFPDIVKIDNIGNTWENRPINMLTIDVDASSLPITSVPIVKVHED
jgi:hypothetical protein